MLKNLLKLIGLLASVAACPRTGAAQGQAVAGVEVRHAFDNTRFDVGNNPRSRGGPAFEAVQGERGAFFIDLHTNATLAVLNASEKVPRPLYNNADAHNAEASAYLFKLGIPTAEVSGMHVTTAMMAGGSVIEGIDPKKAQLLYYTTHFERSVAGIPVQGSFAFVAFDADRQIITEGIYWPAIPSSVTKQALELENRLKSDVGRSEYMQAIRRNVPALPEAAGTVRIVHTSFADEGPFEAKAVFVIETRSPNGGMYSDLVFDDRGAITPVGRHVEPVSDPKRM
ncbi:MAG TPA: hypothetical protein VJR89_11815 [Polyangiales bacterium]|nr:hypothetical protein [Polyangiales bacterium]